MYRLKGYGEQDQQVEDKRLLKEFEEGIDKIQFYKQVITNQGKARNRTEYIIRALRPGAIQVLNQTQEFSLNFGDKVIDALEEVGCFSAAGRNLRDQIKNHKEEQQNSGLQNKITLSLAAKWMRAAVAIDKALYDQQVHCYLMEETNTKS